MNKRIRKKHSLISDPYYKKHIIRIYRCTIGNHIIRKCKDAGVKKYNKRAIWSYTHQLFQHSSHSEWIMRVDEACMLSNTPYLQPYLQAFYSAKHPYIDIERRIK